MCDEILQQVNESEQLQTKTTRPVPLTHAGTCMPSEGAPAAWTGGGQDNPGGGRGGGGRRQRGVCISLTNASEGQ